MNTKKEYGFGETVLVFYW